MYNMLPECPKAAQWLIELNRFGSRLPRQTSKYFPLHMYADLQPQILEMNGGYSVLCNPHFSLAIGEWHGSDNLFLDLYQ